MAETETTSAVYKAAVEIFESSIAATPEAEANMLKERHLSDGTKVMISRQPFPNYISNSDPLSVIIDRGKDLENFNFVLDKDGLLYIHQVIPLFVEIGDLRTRSYNNVVSVNSENIHSEEKDIFRESARPLVDWLKRILEEDFYSTPPILISSL